MLNGLIRANCNNVVLTCDVLTMNMKQFCAKCKNVTPKFILYTNGSCLIGMLMVELVGTDIKI